MNKKIPLEARNISPDSAYKAKYEAAKTVLADREAELLRIKGPCRAAGCRLHYAHSGPCDFRRSS